MIKRLIDRSFSFIDELVVEKDKKQERKNETKQNNAVLNNLGAAGRYISNKLASVSQNYSVANLAKIDSFLRRELPKNDEELVNPGYETWRAFSEYVLTDSDVFRRVYLEIMKKTMMKKTASQVKNYVFSIMRGLSEEDVAILRSCNGMVEPQILSLDVLFMPTKTKVISNFSAFETDEKIKNFQLVDDIRLAISNVLREGLFEVSFDFNEQERSEMMTLKQELLDSNLLENDIAEYDFMWKKLVISDIGKALLKVIF